MQQQILAIANRGEIAIRIARTAERLGWVPVLLLGDADLDSYAARTVGRVEHVESELDPEEVVAAAHRAGASALHPGYGFLSERPELSAACEAAGIVFVGPSPATLEICGDKLATRDAAVRARVPLLPASPPMTTANETQWATHAENVGYPLMVKVSSAGGGRGLRVARSESELNGAVRSALNEAGASGADATFYFERFLEGARHVEVQVAGDGETAVALGDRDCSLQRRHQKVIEEAPAPGLSNETRTLAHSYAVAIASEVRLRGVATVEFLLGRDGTLAFIEVNPRLQVEHTVTEEVTGLDIVEIQLQISDGGPLPDPVPPTGHSIQARLYAEDPARNFIPSPGEIRLLDWPEMKGLRFDVGYEAGDSVSGSYDPLVAKVISRGHHRIAAIARLEQALSSLRVAGIATNRPWLLALLRDERFRNNTHDLATAGDVQVSPGQPDSAALALVARIMLPQGDGQTAWQSAGPFRIVSPATMVFHGLDADWQVSISPSIGGPVATSSIAIQTEEGFELSTPRGRWLVAPGPLTSKASSLRVTDGAVRSPMPGTIISVNVQPGQEVGEGDVVAVMNAMKIEISLAAPFDGAVTDVHAADGELVGSQQVIVTVAPRGEPDE
jgi:acetyl-CoA/propionyl-CoA carboxylase, biotin carboxylase, biotin carboxyl carrier protein